MKAITIEILALIFLYFMLASVQIGPLNVIIFMIIMISVLITSVTLLLKKKYWQSLSLLFMVAFLSFVSYTLGLQIPPQFRKDLYKHSTTIEESRTDNAFICEFQLLTDTIYNKCGIVAKYIFAEYDHHYKNSNSRLFVIDRDRRWLNIVIQNEDEIKNNGYGSKWTIENFSGNRIILPYYNEDTITLSIFEIDTKNIIDSIKMRRMDRRDSILSKVGWRGKLGTQ